jgi:hypothetical protein
MKIYTLVGISKHGKQIVKQHGERWECLQQLVTAPFSDKKGPWLYLEPLGELRVANTVREAREETGARWVHSLTDTDFKVLP